MVTYYCRSLEDALKKAKVAGKEPGCHLGGIVLPGGRRGFAIYREGKVIAQYTGKQSVSQATRRSPCDGGWTGGRTDG